MAKDGPSLTGIIYLVIAIVLILSWILSPVACAPEDRNVVQAVENQGWTEVRLGERHPYFVSWHGCAGSDSFAYEAWARNPAGKMVKVVICSGNTVTNKGVTIRTQ